MQRLSDSYIEKTVLHEDMNRAEDVAVHSELSCLGCPKAEGLVLPSLWSQSAIRIEVNGESMRLVVLIDEPDCHLVTFLHVDHRPWFWLILASVEPVQVGDDCELPCVPRGAKTRRGKWKPYDEKSCCCSCNGSDQQHNTNKTPSLQADLSKYQPEWKRTTEYMRKRPANSDMAHRVLFETAEVVLTLDRPEQLLLGYRPLLP